LKTNAAQPLVALHCAAQALALAAGTLSPECGTPRP
jgi:hypothetical protein